MAQDHMNPEGDMQDQRLSARPLMAVAATAALLLMPASAWANSGSDYSHDAANATEEAMPLAGDIERGETAYAEDCASCHRTPARFMANVPGEDDDARAAWLEDFLPEHYAPDAQDRADIIAWLLAD